MGSELNTNYVKLRNIFVLHNINDFQDYVGLLEKSNILTAAKMLILSLVKQFISYNIYVTAFQKKKHVQK